MRRILWQFERLMHGNTHSLLRENGSCVHRIWKTVGAPTHLCLLRRLVRLQELLGFVRARLEGVGLHYTIVTVFLLSSRCQLGLHNGKIVDRLTTYDFQELLKSASSGRLAMQIGQFRQLQERVGELFKRLGSWLGLLQVIRAHWGRCLRWQWRRQGETRQGKSWRCCK